MAFRLVDAVRELAFTAQWRLMLPVLSERQNNFSALHAAIDRCLVWSSLLAFSAMRCHGAVNKPLRHSGPRAGMATGWRGRIALDRIDRWLFLRISSWGGGHHGVRLTTFWQPTSPASLQRLPWRFTLPRQWPRIWYGWVLRCVVDPSSWL